MATKVLWSYKGHAAFGGTLFADVELHTMASTEKEAIRNFKWQLLCMYAKKRSHATSELCILDAALSENGILTKE